jgi:uncharacterized protein YybS (DUF2232 family)
LVDVESQGQVKTGRSNKDLPRLWLLIGSVTVSGVASGIPLLNAIFYLVGMVSLIILAVRYGYWPGAIGSILMIGSCLLLYGPLLAASCLLMVVIPGLLMSYQARKIGEPRKILLWGMLPYLAPAIVLIAMYPEINSQMPAMIGELNKQLAISGGMFGMAGEGLNQAISSAQSTFEWIIRLLPGIFITMGAAMVLFAYLGAARLGARFGAIMPTMQPVYFWRASELWLIPLGLSLILVLLGGQSFGAIGQNALVFLVHLYALYGLSIAEFYMRQSMGLGWLRIILYLLIIIAAIVIVPMLAFIGLLDSRFDLRKIDEKKVSSS